MNRLGTRASAISKLCPVCGTYGTNFSYYESHTVEYKTERIAYTIFECETCHSHFADPAKAAPGEWYADIGEYYGWRWEFECFLEDLGGLYPSSSLTIMEIGSGEGIVLEKLAQNHDVLGLELNHEAVGIAKSKGLTVCPITLEAFKVQYPDMRFDVVCFFQVLEHLACPEKFLKDIGAVLQPHGYIFLSIPNPGRYWVRIERESWDYPPHHLLRFSKGGIESLLKRSGFDLVKSLAQPSPKNLTRIFSNWMINKLSWPKLLKRVLKSPLRLVLWPVASYYTSSLDKNYAGDSLYLVARIAN